MLPDGLDTSSFSFGASGDQLQRERERENVTVIDGSVHCVEKDGSLRLFTLQWNDRNVFCKNRSLFSWFCFSRDGLAV